MKRSTLSHRKTKQEMWLWCPKLFLRDPSVTPETEHLLSSFLSCLHMDPIPNNAHVPFLSLCHLTFSPIKTHLWPIQSAKVFVFIPIEHLLQRQAIPQIQSATTCSFYIYIWPGTPEISVKSHTTQSSSSIVPSSKGDIFDRMPFVSLSSL